MVSKMIDEQSVLITGGTGSLDIKLTERLAQAGEIMGIDVLDHIIISDKNFLSLKSKGLF